MSPDPREPLQPESFAARLKAKHGEGVDPEVSLGGAPSDVPSGATSELLKRLADHGVASPRYKLEGEVARGGMGAILRVWDEDLRRHLAMKVVLGKGDVPGSGGSPQLDTKVLARFLEEAQITGQLDHPGIVPVHELGLDADGRVYFTMKLVKGRDLKEIFDLVFKRKEGWNEARALGVILKACEAMAYAHKKGVIHRDLKPANVMVGGFGEVYVMDWGLARVLGRKDTHDIRLNGVPSLPMSSVNTERREEREDTPDSPLVTMDGDVMGTPAYMPLEQARGEVEKLSPRSDVYSIGAMLYHLLARQMPYVPPGARVSNRTVLARVLDGPPRPLHEIQGTVPAELEAICEKAMARAQGRRYADTSALAEDLRAYLEHRVVSAHETGTWAETKKWVTRNKPLAASLAAGVLVLVVGVVTSLFYAGEARQQAVVAKQQAEIAEEKTLAESRLKGQAIAREREQRVRGLIQDLKAFEALDDSLAFAREQRRPANEWWIERARLLIDGRKEDPAKNETWKPGLADVEAELANVRAQALAWTEAERVADRNAHPRAKELEEKLTKLEWLSRMLGLEPWPSEAEVEARLAKEATPADANGLDYAAWDLVDPHAPVFGQEMKGLWLARRAVEVASDEDRAWHRETLARALFRCGRFEDALAEQRLAANTIVGIRREEAESNLARMESEVASWRDEASRKVRAAERDSLAAEVASLEREMRKWRFADSEKEWWHAQLTQLAHDLQGLKVRVAIAERSVRDPVLLARWREAIAAVSSNQEYREVKWPNGIRLTPQIGLVPIGPDPASGLWEFAHLETGEPAERGPDGKLVLHPETGLVFVLLPGGRVPVEQVGEMGQGRQDDALTDIDLDPFFLSKYEMTNVQWDRMGGWRIKSEHTVPPMLPVIDVSWDECTVALAKSIAWVWLPSEAQWEFACRAGTRTPWWTGKDAQSLVGAASIHHGDNPEPDDLLEVGWLRPNSFGFHDVHGNALEWCRDALSMEEVVPGPGDGVLDVPNARSRVFRGGCSVSNAADARSSMISGFTATDHLDWGGLRPARGITP